MNISIRHKFIISLFAVVLFSLSLSGMSLFYVFKDLHDRHAREQVQKAFTMLEQELTSRADSLMESIRIMAGREELISSMNMISEYQSVEEYMPILFDVEKKKITAKLAEQAESAHVDLIAVYDAHKALSAFVLKDRGRLREGIISYNQEAQPIVYVFASDKRETWIESALPPGLVLTHATLPSSGAAIYRKVDGGIGMEGSVPIIRALPDGTKKHAGFIKMVHVMGHDFARDMSDKFHMDFSFFADGEHGVGTFENLEFSDPVGDYSSLFSQKTIENIRWLDHDKYFLHAHFFPVEGGAKVWCVTGPEKRLLTDSITRTAMILTGVLLCSAFIVILAGGLAADHMITKPVMRLEIAVKAFKEGHYEALNATTDDEIGRLTASFGDMALTIQQRGEKIEHYRVHLEKMVDERTEALKESELHLKHARDAALEAQGRAEAAQRASEVANQAKSTFIASISHELRTPLNAILGFSQMMRNRCDLSPECLENLTIIQQRGDDLLALINRMIDIARIEDAPAAAERIDAVLKELQQGDGAQKSDAVRQLETNKFAASLTELPSGLLADLEQAILNVDVGQIYRIIERIRAQDAALADALKENVDNFEYETILTHIQL